MSCRQQPERPWQAAIPADLPALITVEENVTLQEVLEKEYIPFLDDISNAAIPLVQEISDVLQTNIKVKAMLLAPHSSKSWQPVWITEVPEGTINQLRQVYFREFKQNYYLFNDLTINKLSIGQRIIFASQIGNWLLFSESSFGLEESLRAFLKKKPAMDLPPESIGRDGLVINPAHLDRWIKQLAEIGYYPNLDGILQGTFPTFFSVKSSEDNTTNLQHEFSGIIPVKPDKASLLTAAVSFENSPIVLDQYISENAASFAILKLPPPAVPADSIEAKTPLDSLLLADKSLYNEIRNTLNNEFAFVSYEESGFLSEGEELFLRHLSDFQEFFQILKRLERQGYIEEENGTIFYVRSRILAQLIGSPACNLSEFYLTNAYKAAVLANRRGRAESIKADRSRRRVIYYEDDYLNLRESFPDEMSGFVAAYSNRFLNYLQPFLANSSYAATLVSGFDFFTMTFRKQQQPTAVQIEMKTYNLKRSNQPYEERWVFPVDNASVTAKPTLADIGGSSRDEVLFTTSAGKLYALATDGTIVMQTSMSTDVPIGSPIVYDWYGNNQDAILQAAGNKIYGWNTVGQPLPQFPITLDETISAPPVVADVTRDGIPELIVATRDRQIHVVNGRGQNIEGWPKTLNSTVISRPLFEKLEEEWSIFAFADNALHSWRSDGSLRAGFPVFINASFNGSPLIYKNQVIGNGSDGHLYSVGTQPLFTDSLNVISKTNNSAGEDGETVTDSLMTEAVYVSNSALEGTPSIHNLTVTSTQDSSVVRKSMFLTMSSNGSVFLIGETGELLFTKSMGQPAARNFDPVVSRLADDNRPEVVALANFGRLYAWDVYSGERMYSLPATGMSHLIITDFEGDGEIELIAETREGLRSWTLSGN